MASRRRPHTVSLAPALNNLRTGQNHEAPYFLYMGGREGGDRPALLPDGRSTKPRRSLPCCPTDKARIQGQFRTLLEPAG